jgi:putative membrane protein
VPALSHADTANSGNNSFNTVSFPKKMLLIQKSDVMRDYRFLKFLITSLAVFLASMILPGVDVSNMLIAIVIAAFLGLLNAFVRPVLVFLTIPVTLVTLGLFLIVINGFIIVLIDAIIPDVYFNVRNFWYAMLFSIVLSVISSLLERILGVRPPARGE